MEKKKEGKKASSPETKGSPASWSSAAAQPRNSWGMAVVQGLDSVMRHEVKS
jgi:hypothetical protein